jgi:Domain of unknown function DUF29
MADDQHRGDLYERDFYQWTQAQAEALRAEAARRGGGSNAVDWEQVAEEIEDMGKSDLRECFSRVETIIEHLFKLAWSSQETPRGGWRSTILRERNALELVMTPSLRPKVEQGLAQRHQRALRLAEDAFAQNEPDAARDVSLSWTLPQILGEAGDPLA